MHASIMYNEFLVLINNIKFNSRENNSKLTKGKMKVIKESHVNMKAIIINKIKVGTKGHDATKVVSNSWELMDFAVPG